MSYQTPNTPAAIVAELGLPLNKDQERKLEDALSLIQQNNTTLENFLNQTTQTIPLLTDEPTSPSDGNAWINTTLNEFHIRMAGVTRVVTVV